MIEKKCKYCSKILKTSSEGFENHGTSEGFANHNLRLHEDSCKGKQVKINVKEKGKMFNKGLGVYNKGFSDGWDSATESLTEDIGEVLNRSGRRR